MHEFTAWHWFGFIVWELVILVIAYAATSGTEYHINKVGRTVHDHHGAFIVFGIINLILIAMVWITITVKGV